MHYFIFIDWSVDPRIWPPFETLRWYGLCWAIGFWGGYQVISKLFIGEGRGPQQVDQLALYLVVGVVLGARLGHILFYEPNYYWAHPIEILPIRISPKFEFIGFRGLASHGGVIGALIASYLFSKKHQCSFLTLLDQLTIAGTLLGGFIRLGNLMNSEIIGSPTQVPWAFIFHSVDSIPRHPAQIYESSAYFLISLVLYRNYQSTNRNWKDGFLFGLGMSLVFMARFFIEFFKENQVAMEAGWTFNIGQLLSIPMIVIGLIFAWNKRR